MLELATILLIAAVVAGGMLGGVIRGWSLISRVHILEENVLRLQKQYAAQEKWGTKNLRDRLEAELSARPGANAAVEKQPFLKFGGKHGVPG